MTGVWTAFLAGAVLFCTEQEAAAANYEVFAGASLVFRPVSTLGVGFRLEATGSALPLRFGPVASAFVRGELMWKRPPALIAGGRTGVGLAEFTDCWGYIPLPQVEGLLAAHFSRDGIAPQVGVGVIAAFGGGEVSRISRVVRRDGEQTDPDWEIALGAQLPTIAACVAGRPVRGPDGRAALPVTSRVDAQVEQGRQEQSSIAEFLRLANLLGALGAPPELVARCRAAADDEARHAVLRYCRAAQDGWLAVGPVRVPRNHLIARREALIELAVRSVREGVHGEGEAAAQGLRGSQLEARIAEDELRHARLSGDIVAWCAREESAARRAARRAERSLLS